jgi:hypothetical protein
MRLPHGHDGPALTVRAVTAAGVDGLDALFQGLSQDDRHHRFFSLRPPARTFLEQMTRAEDEGGYRLVAVASGAKDALVAEPGYAILPAGDGEFALRLRPRPAVTRVNVGAVASRVTVSSAADRSIEYVSGTRTAPEAASTGRRNCAADLPTAEKPSLDAAMIVPGMFADHGACRPARPRRYAPHR